jgi:hypothetical protein
MFDIDAEFRYLDCGHIVVAAYTERAAEVIMAIRGYHYNPRIDGMIVVPRDDVNDLSADMEDAGLSVLS